MSMFNEKDVIKALEADAKEKLRRAGLSRVRFTIVGGLNRPQVKLDADNEEDLKRAQSLFTK
jgi:hypothetical protein